MVVVTKAVRRILVPALGLALVGGCDDGGGPGSAGTGVRPGLHPPPLAVELVDGAAPQAVDLAAYRGKILVLGFWLGGCAPCLEEIPELQALARGAAGQGVAVLLVNVGGNRRIVEDLARDFDVAFPLALDTLSLTADRYGVGAFPTTFVIDRDGVIRARLAGEQKPGHLTQAVAALF
jgi:thiol-disulfide isomerase/thioredoxin